MFCKKGVLKNFVNLTRKNLCQSFIFAGFRPATLLKKRLRTGVFCQFWEIFKNTFFIEHLQWLLLPILKRLDSQRQLCKWISKLVTIYFIWTFLVLAGIFVFIFGEHNLSFYFSTALWSRKCDVFDFSRDHTIDMQLDFLGDTTSSLFSTLSSFSGHEPCERVDKTLLICNVTSW